MAKKSKDGLGEHTTLAERMAKNSGDIRGTSTPQMILLDNGTHVMQVNGDQDVIRQTKEYWERMTR